MNKFDHANTGLILADTRFDFQTKLDNIWCFFCFLKQCTYIQNFDREQQVIPIRIQGNDLTAQRSVGLNNNLLVPGAYFRRYAISSTNWHQALRDVNSVLHIKRAIWFPDLKIFNKNLKMDTKDIAVILRNESIIRYVMQNTNKYYLRAYSFWSPLQFMSYE